MDLPAGTGLANGPVSGTSPHHRASAGLAPAASLSGCAGANPQRTGGAKARLWVEAVCDYRVRGANKHRRARLRPAAAAVDDARRRRRTGGVCHEWIGILPPEDADAPSAPSSTIDSAKVLANRQRREWVGA